MKDKKNNSMEKNIIISDPKYKSYNPHIKLMRITLNKNESKFDFGYKAVEYYEKGGWIRISPKTFIRPKGSEKKLILTNATNIPYGPEMLHFNSTIEWRYFSLYFPPIDKDVKSIDLIEKEVINVDRSQFNFLDIVLNDSLNHNRIA